MKKVFWLGVVLSFLFVTDSVAASYTLTVPTPTSNVITATMSGATGSTSTFQLQLQTTAFPATAAVQPSVIQGQDPTIQKPNAQGVVTWSLSESSGTTYYVTVVEIPVSMTTLPSYATASQTVTTPAGVVPLLPLTSSTSGSNLVISGKIDTTKLPTGINAGFFTPTLEYSASSATNTAGALSTPINPPLSTDKGVSTTDGTYQWTINENKLTPNTTYYFQQTVTDNDGDSKIDSVINIDSSSGSIVATGVTGSTLSSSSYTLLSGGFPGLSVIPSAQQCASQQAAATAAGKSVPLCSVNDLLNYAMQLLIGLCGVVLVLRLMFEGYQYMVTDVPYLKASSKAGFMTALLGLLLALTSYIILNTINPKLVTESVGVVPLTIGVTEPDIDVAPITQNGSTPTSGTAAGACTAGVTTVTVQKSSFVACSTYKGIPIAANLSSMLTAAYAAGITLEGSGFRTYAQQVQLRIAHCNGNITDKNATCTPLTAVPGTSNHESGLAFDFNCNGGSAYNIATTQCFSWLQANAGTYGLKNLPAEPWHWSWNGL